MESLFNISVKQLTPKDLEERSIFFNLIKTDSGVFLKKIINNQKIIYYICENYFFMLDKKHKLEYKNSNEFNYSGILDNKIEQCSLEDITPFISILPKNCVKRLLTNELVNNHIKAESPEIHNFLLNKFNWGKESRNKLFKIVRKEGLKFYKNKPEYIQLLNKMVKYLCEYYQEKESFKINYGFFLSSSDISRIKDFFQDFEEEYTELYDLLSEIENGLNCTFGMDYQNFFNESFSDKLIEKICDKFKDGFINNEANQIELLKIFKNRNMLK